MARKDPRRNITRIETKTSTGQVSRGWMVRFQRRNEKTRSFFSDSVYGGNRNALVAAKAFRDQTEASTTYFSTRELANKPSIRNQSGTVGVQLHREVKIRGGYEYYYWFWVAQWIDGRGQRKTRSFSVHRYGDEEAHRMAVAARRKGVAQANR